MAILTARFFKPIESFARLQVGADGPTISG
jgi:hypothetical protein